LYRRFLAAAIVSTAALVSPTGAAASGYHSCRGGVDVDGTIRLAPGGFFRAIKARQLSCPAARRVVRRFVIERPVTEVPLRRHVTFKLNGRHWNCRARMVPARNTPEGWLPPYEKIGCKAVGGRRVRFIGAS
jgi:hypothetical protein